MQAGGKDEREGKIFPSLARHGAHARTLEALRRQRSVEFLVPVRARASFQRQAWRGQARHARTHALLLGAVDIDDQRYRRRQVSAAGLNTGAVGQGEASRAVQVSGRSEEHTSEL